MATDSSVRRDASRYAELGLIANPFDVQAGRGGGLGVGLEIQAAANRLLAAVASAASSAAPRPIVVSKTTDVPTSYSLRAASAVESALINDESLNTLHAYVQLFMMRKGRVRSTLGAVGERLAFRSFDQTLARFCEAVLETPDESLASYAEVGPERLSRFLDGLSNDPEGTIARYFGDSEIERRPELAEVADVRLVSLDDDVDEGDVSTEVDATVGYAPGTGVGLPQAESDTDHELKAVVDYLIEYTAVHLSTVIARGLRMYRERGLAALSAELKVTKAPRKTLAAVVKLARARFDKVAIIYNGFENWASIDTEMRQTIVTSLTEMRWLLDGDAVFVLLLERDGVPELEEQFGAGTKVDWDFPWLVTLQNAPDELNLDMVRFWSESAVLLGHANELTALEALAEDAGGSLGTFVAAASAAIEDAADRSVGTIDSAALDAGRRAVAEEAG